MAQMTASSAAPAREHRIPPPTGAREPLKVNVYERMQHANTQLVPLFPYYGPGAIVYSGALFRGGPGLRRRTLLPLQHRRRDLVRLGCERRASRDRSDHGAAEPPRRQQLPARPRVARQLSSRDDRAATERHRGPDREAHLAVHEVSRAPVRARVHRSPDRRPRGSLPRASPPSTSQSSRSLASTPTSHCARARPAVM